MQGEGDAAAAAFENLPAAQAADPAPVAAPVQEDERLPAGGDGLPERGLEHGGEDQRPPGGLPGRVPVVRAQQGAHVHHLHRGERAARDAVGEPQPGERLPLGGVRRFERGGGRTEHQHRAGGAGAEPGGPAGVVAGRLVLLVGGVVLLVEDHQPEVPDGGEHRGAGPEHDARLAPPDAPEGGAALGGAEPAVEHGEAGAEAGAEERLLLGGERDLGDQQQRAAPRFQAGGDGLEIDLGLPAAGDPVEQEGAEGAGFEGLPEGGRGFALGCGERRRARRRVVAGTRRAAGARRLGRQPLGAGEEKPLAFEAGEAPARGEFEFAADADQRDRAAGDREQGEDAPVVLAQPRQRASGAAAGPSSGPVVGLPEARGALRGDARRPEHPAGGRRGREHRPEDQPERADRHLGELARQGEEVFRERRQRIVEARADGLEGRPASPLRVPAAPARRGRGPPR